MTEQSPLRVTESYYQKMSYKSDFTPVLTWCDELKVSDTGAANERHRIIVKSFSFGNGVMRPRYSEHSQQLSNNGRQAAAGLRSTSVTRGSLPDRNNLCIVFVFVYVFVFVFACVFVFVGLRSTSVTR